MSSVNGIIKEDIQIFIEWLQSAPLRAFLSQYKIVINEKVKDYFKDNEEEYNNQKIKTVTNKIMRKLMAETESLKSLSKINAIIYEQTSLLKKTVN